MKKKLKILSNIAIICLSVCMFAFGVYAANQVSVTTSGTVSFTATDVFATVSRTISGSSADATHNEIEPITIDSSVNDDADPFAMDADLEFDSATTPIVMSFKIKNEATEPGRDLFFKVSDNGSTLEANDNVRKVCYDLDFWGSIAPGDEYIIDIELWVVDANTSVSECEYSFAFDLKNSLSEEGYYTLTKDDVTFSNGTITKFASSVASKEKIVIPSSINGVEVTQLGNGSVISDSALSATEIVVPLTVLTIGANCFYADGAYEVTESLTKIYLPNVTNIGDNAFTYSGVRQVNIKNCVSVGSGAFNTIGYYGSYDSVVTISNKLKTIGAGENSYSVFSSVDTVNFIGSLDEFLIRFPNSNNIDTGTVINYNGGSQLHNIDWS